jgi:hypothetical protein
MLHFLCIYGPLFVLLHYIVCNIFVPGFTTKYVNDKNETMGLALCAKYGLFL